MIGRMNNMNKLETELMTWGKKGFNEALKQATFLSDLSKINFFNPLGCDEDKQTDIRINVLNTNEFLRQQKEVK